MDMTYALSFTRRAIQAGHPEDITHVAVRPAKHDPRVDAAMYANLVFKGQESQRIASRIYVDMDRAWAACGTVPRFWELPSIEVETEDAIIFFYNLMMPHLYHYISILEKKTGKVSYVKQYSGGPLWGNVTTSNGGKGGHSSWSTYRWQLEAFVDAVRGKTPAYWISGKESVTQMEVIDSLYKAAGLPVRPTNWGTWEKTG